MMDKIYRILYGPKWLFCHFGLSLITSVLCGLCLMVLEIDYQVILRLISKDTIFLSATIAGFVFAGMSIFISLDGNKKMLTISSIGSENIIYGVLIVSVTSFIISMLLMGLDLVVFNINIEQMSKPQLIVKTITQWSSIYSLLFGYLVFLSSLKLIYWMLKK